MSIDYEPRSAWRNRGRPATQADPAIVARLRATYDNGTVAVLRLGDDADQAEVRQTITQLRAAARQLGLRLRLQPRRSADIIAAGELRFFAEDE